MRMGCIRRLSIWGCSEKSRMGERKRRVRNRFSERGKRTLKYKNEKSREVRAEQLITEKVKFQHRSLEERARDFGGKLGPYTEYDWGEPKGREIL